MPADPPDNLIRLRQARYQSNQPKLANPNGPPEHSEDALALRFAEEYKDKLKFVATWGQWMQWQGTYWAFEKTLLAFDLARKLCRSASTGNLMPGQPTGIDSALTETQAVRLASAKTVNAVANLARSDRRIAESDDAWDQDQNLLNTPTGTVDTKEVADGIRIKPHDPDDRITKITTTGPDPACPVDLWNKFLARITAGDRTLKDYLQRISGYVCTGHTYEQALFFFYGTGANGKSVFVNTISGILGDYAMTAPIDTFVVAKGDRHPTDLASLHGARLVVAHEPEKGARWAEAKIKVLTGGEKISARFMHQNFFEFIPTFKLWITGNHMPSLSGVNEASRRRIQMIPFSVTIPPEERDKQLFEKLKAEWPGILAWMLEGCQSWRTIGLAPPNAVIDATQEYLSEEDAMTTWIEERCQTDSHTYFEANTLLWNDWKDWCHRRNEDPGTQNAFSRALGERGYRKDKSQGVRGRKGIMLKHRPNQDGFGAERG